MGERVGMAMNDEMERAEASANLCVMVCETSRVQRRLLAEILEDGGFTVLEAGDSREALARVEREGCEIFITGVEVGEISGLEACWRLKAGADTSHIHTIVITASDQRMRVAEALDAGADDFIRKPFDAVEMKPRLRAAARIVRLQQDLRRQAETDALTGAANRRAFMRALQREAAEAARLQVPLGAAMIDLDHFKSINDTHGHASGDRVLVRTIERIRAELGANETLGRLGGEEFAIVLPRRDLESTLETAERLRVAIAHMAVHDDRGARIPVTASIGAVALEAGETTAYATAPGEILRRADEALYEAKAGGRNRVCAAGPADSSKAAANAL